MEEQQPEMSEEEIAERLSQLVGTNPLPEEKYNIHTFLHRVATSDDTTKTGFLRDDKDLNEIGIPRLPLRTLKELGLFCKDVANMGFFSDYFLKRGEILTSTSLSRNAKLLELSVIQRKEISAISKVPMRENKSWFKKKTEPEETY